jgi:hypothetical protein
VAAPQRSGSATPLAEPAAAAVASHMNGTLIALTLQPDSEEPPAPTNPLSDGDVAIFVAFVVVIAAVFSFDMVRTWWETNQWRRDARRRRRELR